MRMPPPAVLRFAPVSLLVLGIAVHGVRIVGFDEDPQRGSGFAMFAGVDMSATRRVQATVPGTPDIILEIPPALDDEIAELRDSPTEGRARRLANMLLDRDWTVDEQKARDGGGTRLDVVKVEVVGLVADGRDFSRKVLTEAIAQGRQG